MEFAAPKSIWVKIITAVLAVGFAGLCAVIFVVDEDRTAVVFPMAILLLVLGLSYYYSVVKYEVLPDKIIVHRPFDKVVIPTPGIAATRLDKKDIRLSIRTFGIGGVFSYTGTFWNSKLGNMTWYVSKMDHAVLLVDARNNKTVISPGNPEKFIAALQD